MIFFICILGESFFAGGTYHICPTSSSCHAVNCHPVSHNKISKEKIDSQWNKKRFTFVLDGQREGKNSGL